jgi:hypothetical protein
MAVRPALAFLALLALSGVLGTISDAATLTGPLNQFRWLRSWIVEGPGQELDYVFVGSSKTLTGIDPLLIEAELPGTKAMNATHYEFGHDIDYYLIEPLLRRHRIENLVIEIPMSWKLEPHSQIKHQVHWRSIWIEARGMLESLHGSDEPSIQQAIKQRVGALARFVMTAAFAAPAAHLDPLWEALGIRDRGEIIGAKELDASQGFSIRDHFRKQNPSFLKSTKSSNFHPFDGAILDQSFAKDRLARAGASHDLYLRKIVDLARRHDTRLHFLFIPKWAARPLTRETHAYYSQFGDVLIPDLRSYRDVSYYSDWLHLVRAGPDKLSVEVAGLLRDGPALSPYHAKYEVRGQ